MLEALDALVRARRLARAVELARRGLVDGVDQERRLAAAGDAGDAGEHAERDRRGDVLEVVRARADDLQLALRIGLAPRLRHGYLAHAGEVFRGEARGIGDQLLRRALRDDLAAMHAGAGADVDDVVGGEDRVLVMLDDEHGVAEVAQMLQRHQQAGVVALMQPDRRLVEHVEHAGQARADLRRETNALAFAARQRARAARQRQVVEPDVDEEFQAVADLLEDARRDLRLLRRECRRQVREPGVGRADRQRRDLADVLAADLDAERLRLQAIAAAGGAGVRALVARQLIADPVAVGLAPAPLDVGDHALERLGGLVGAQAVLVGERDLLAVGAEQDGVLDLARQLVPRRRHVELVVFDSARSVCS